MSCRSIGQLLQQLLDLLAFVEEVDGSAVVIGEGGSGVDAQGKVSIGRVQPGQEALEVKLNRGVDAAARTMLAPTVSLRRPWM